MSGPSGPYKTGPFKASYKEYDRAAVVAGRAVVPYDAPEPAGITVIIHPNSPTGDHISLAQLEEIVQKAQSEGGVVLVDESFIAFYGPDWHSQSAFSLIPKYPDSLIVVVSWTKLWACPGLRLGSVACGEKWYKIFKKNQTPWSCNSLAQQFFVSVCRDHEYMQQTWDTIPQWRQRHEGLLQKLGWTWNESSPAWVPWLFVDCGTEAAAEKAFRVAFEVGCPVRWCKSFGCPTSLRLGIREPKSQDVLQQAWEQAFL